MYTALLIQGGVSESTRLTLLSWLGGHEFVELGVLWELFDEAHQ